jgi:hypothetical protein
MKSTPKVAKPLPKPFVEDITTSAVINNNQDL